MKFLVDEALSPVEAALLCDSGEDAVHVSQYDLISAKDQDILERAESEDRVVVSADTDFGTLLALRQRRQPSFILFRGGPRRPEQQAAMLLAQLPNIAAELEKGCIVVFHDQRVRVRSLPIFGR